MNFERISRSVESTKFVVVRLHYRPANERITRIASQRQVRRTIGIERQVLNTAGQGKHTHFQHRIVVGIMCVCTTVVLKINTPGTCRLCASSKQEQEHKQNSGFFHKQPFPIG